MYIVHTYGNGQWQHLSQESCVRACVCRSLTSHRSTWMPFRVNSLSFFRAPTSARYLSQPFLGAWVHSCAMCTCVGEGGWWDHISCCCWKGPHCLHNRVCICVWTYSGHAGYVWYSKRLRRAMQQTASRRQVSRHAHKGSPSVQLPSFSHKGHIQLYIHTYTAKTLSLQVATHLQSTPGCVVWLCGSDECLRACCS